MNVIIHPVKVVPILVIAPKLQQNEAYCNIFHHLDKEGFSLGLCKVL